MNNRDDAERLTLRMKNSFMALCSNISLHSRLMRTFSRLRVSVSGKPV